MDISSLTGILIGFVVIVGALFLEGGTVSSIIQPKAALIVLGGTMAAGMINFPISVFANAVKELKNIFGEEKLDFNGMIANIGELAGIARQQGILVIQHLIHDINDPFLKKSMRLSIDTTDRAVLEEIFNSELKMEEEKGLVLPIFFESLGGYAPTFGIIGAVLGLIQVMSSVENPAELGHGISTAFVATLYGVGAANLIFLPIAGKLRFRLREKLLYKKLITQGILSIHKGENPTIAREKLLNYV
ncbi:MAG: hypothetical protein A2Y25_00390 [Candidatus Melainabacteria bacterium GWF2_37_15]|nr:MAG: hypothetical protein A2Y25_00390 [Candidatus Melainabacteria bacterium GWF2_37_15]